MGAEGNSSDSKLCGAEQDVVAINIRCSSGSKFTVRTTLHSTISAFKNLLAENCDVPAAQQRLIYKGRILKDDETLHSNGLQDDHTVHMVRGFVPASSTPAPAPVTATNPNTTPGVTRGVGSTDGGAFGGAGLGASLFPGLGLNPLGGGTGGAPGLFGAGGLPEFDQMQQQLTQNPRMMGDIMNTPAMQSLMNDPDFIRSMLMSNPQMREIVDRNPELAHVLNDPGVLRQALEAARNPEIMREMVRHTDRAMSNIESSPEGFNMLRRMYENVQEPLLNATSMGADTVNDIHLSPFASLLGNQGGALASDTSSSPSTTGSETTAGLTAPNTNPLPNPWSSTTGGIQTNTAGRPNPSGNARAPGPAGLGGLGLPGMEQMFNGMPDFTQMNQLLQNPVVSQMMQSMLSNPEYMNQMLNGNPQLRSMTDLNPQLREMMQNPEFFRRLTSPETLQQMMALQQSLFSPLNQQPSMQETMQPGATAGMPNTGGLDLLMNMFGGLGTGNLSVPNQPNVPPEELYATQLSQLQEMGFFDTQENIRALRAAGGNVHAAVERLLASGQ